jgi:hypothetical protein
MEHDDPTKQAALIEIRDQITGTSSACQCARLLAALHRFAVTSFEAMRFLDVYHVPARILQLRQAGHAIDTHWRTVETESNDKHRVGLYALRRG